LLATPAAADEIWFTCNYQLGSGTEATRKKVGSVIVAMDVTAKAARIDFGKGWFKKMTLMVDGTDIKETSPPASGKELGFFYFDLAENTGGFSGGSDNHEFFDACVRTKVGAKVALSEQAAPDLPIFNPPSAKESRPPPAAPPKPAASAPARQPPTKNSSGEPREKFASAPDANLTPDSEKQTSRAPAVAPPTPQQPAEPATPANSGSSGEPKISPPPAEATGAEARGKSSTETATSIPAVPPTSPQTTGQGTTEYFGSKPSKKAAVASEAAIASEPEEHASEPPAPHVQPASPPAAGQATTEYFGKTDSSEKPASPSPTPAPAGTSVSATAIDTCRDALGVELRSAKVTFANSSSVIVTASRAELRKIATIAKNCGSVAIEVRGHTDDLGDPVWNKFLSQHRADAVVDFLAREGVPSANLKGVGYGSEQPIAANTTSAGRRLNRRVELRVSGAATSN
ncbi:MAG: OmpA family protein, partial [Hyphomicrobium sp.]